MNSNKYRLFEIVAVVSLFLVLAPISYVNASGELDLNFNPGPITRGGNIDNFMFLYAVAVQPDGKIIVGGDFDEVNFTPRPLIARFDRNGTLDSGFNTPLQFDQNSYNTVYDIVIQPDDKILVAGSFTINGTKKYLVRLNPDGSLDNSFNVNFGGSTDNIYKIVLQPDGKIIIGSNGLDTVDGVPVNYLARLNTDGSLDTPLGALSNAKGSFVFAIALQPDGKIVVGGSFYLVRLNPNGTDDLGFSPPDIGSNTVYAIALEPNGRILYGGNANASGPFMGRAGTNGTVDSSFAPVIEFGSVIWKILPESDGKIIIGGEFNRVNGVQRGDFARLNPDGTLNSFNAEPYGTDWNVEDIAEEASGNVIIVGSFQNFFQSDGSTIRRTGIARLKDPKYSLSSSANGTGQIVVDDDLDVYLNGALVYTDGTSTAGGRAPIRLAAVPGDSIRLVVRDTYGDCSSLSPVYLTDPNGNGQLVDSGFSLPCGRPTGDQGIVHDFTFTIPSLPNTNTGTNVQVQANAGDATVTFAQVTGAGNTTFTAIDPSSAGIVPSGYTLCPNCPAYDISTTATYTPPVTVCIDVPAAIDAATFNALSLLHGENGVLVDVTTGHVTNPDGTREVCGQVSSLSPFVMAQYAAPTPTPTPTPTTIIVTNTNDSGTGSLRQALADANDGDTIAFSLTLPATITLTSGELLVERNVTINGPGANQLSISGTIHISSGRTVSVNGLTSSAGGVLNDHATLDLNDCVVTGAGPGIRNDGTGLGGGTAVLTINRSTVSNNHSVVTGGLLNEGGVVTIDSSRIVGNSASNPTGSSGGGIANAGTLVINNSEIAGNFTSDSESNCNCAFGGGISNGGTLTISNSTVSGNYSIYGGGISNGGTLTISNSTIADNSFFLGSGTGAGIYNSGSMSVKSTIFNNPAGANIVSPSGTVVSTGYNLSSDSGGGFLTATGDQINTDPLLGPLQDNGGPTFTHALLTGSPAIDAGDPNFAPPPDYDQRGIGFPRVFNGRIDVGAFENQSVTPTPTPTPIPTPTPTPSPTLPAAPSNLMVTAVLRAEIDLAWVDNSTNESNFELERCDGKGKCKMFVLVASPGQNVISYMDIGLLPSTSYAYRVRAANLAGKSAYSNTAKAKTLRR